MRNTKTCTTGRRHNKSRRRFSGLRMLLLAAVLLFCSGCDAGPENLFPATTINSVGSAVKGGILTVPIPEETVPLQPLTETSREMCSLAGLIFEPLISFSSSGDPASCLAQSWQVDDSRLIWTLSLREGVMWHGLSRDVSADDVDFTLDLIHELGWETSYYELFSYVDSWEVIDRYTIAITMKYPFYGVINGLDFPVLPEGCGYGADAAPDIPVGTGPYEVIENDSETGMVLTVNDQWWQKAPYIEEIHAVPFSDTTEALSALVLQQLDAVQVDILTANQYRDSGDANVYEYSTRYFEFLAPNFSSLYLQDVRVRQAIAYALDRQAIASNVYVNHAIVVDTPVSPTSWLYQGQLAVYDQNLEEANRLLKLAGWKNTDDDKWLDVSPSGVEDSLSLVLLTYDEPDRSNRYDAARLIQTQLAEVGIQIDIRSESWDVFVQMMQEGTYDLLLAGWYISDIPDFTFAFGSESDANVSGYKSDQMDALLEQALQQDTEEGLLAVCDQMQQLIINDLPIISLYFRTHTLLTTLPVLGVSNISEDDAFGGIANWYIDPGLLS